MFQSLSFGGVAERLKAAVLKTVRPQKGLVGSNPTPSAIMTNRLLCFPVTPPPRRPVGKGFDTHLNIPAAEFSIHPDAP
jgi:hypothetical protein